MFFIDTVPQRYYLNILLLHFTLIKQKSDIENISNNSRYTVTNTINLITNLLNMMLNT